MKKSTFNQKTAKKRRKKRPQHGGAAAAAARAPKEEDSQGGSSQPMLPAGQRQNRPKTLHMVAVVVVVWRAGLGGWSGGAGVGGPGYPVAS